MYNPRTGLFEPDVPLEPPPLVPYEPVGYGPPPLAAPEPALGELLDQEPAYVSPEPYFGGGGAERRIGDIYPISPKFVAPALARGPFTPQLEERLPEISRTAPSTIFQPEFVRPYAETAYGYGKQPEPSMEPLRKAAPYVIGALAADPTQGASYEALEPVRQGVEATTEAIAGAASVGLRGQVGDVDAYRRQAERIREAGLGEGLRRSYQEESIPFVTGAVQEVVNPANLAFGFEPAIARGLIAGTAAAGRAAAPAARAAGRAAREAIEEAAPAVRRFATDEAGELRFTQGVAADVPQTPEQWYRYAKAILNMDELATETQAVTAPRLMAKQRREWQSIVSKWEKEHPLLREAEGAPVSPSEVAAGRNAGETQFQLSAIEPSGAPAPEPSSVQREYEAALAARTERQQALAQQDRIAITAEDVEAAVAREGLTDPHSVTLLHQASGMLSEQGQSLDEVMVTARAIRQLSEASGVPNEVAALAEAIQYHRGGGPEQVLRELPAIPDVTRQARERIEAVVRARQARPEPPEQPPQLGQISTAMETPTLGELLETAERTEPGAPAGPAGAAGRVPLLEEPPMGASGITRGGLVSEPASAGAPPTGVALPAEDAMTGAREPALGELSEQRPPVAAVEAPGGAETTAVTPSVEAPALPEAGAPGAPPVEPPREPPIGLAPEPEGRERGLTSSMRKSPIFGSDVFQRLVDENPIVYDPITNRETMAAAVARVNSDPELARARVLAEGARGLDIQTEGLVLMRRAQDAGEVAEVYRIGKAIAAMGTRGGQEVQIWSQLDRMSPEGFMVAIHREVAEAEAKGKGGAVQVRMEKRAAELERQRLESELTAARQQRVRWEQEARELEKAARVKPGTTPLVRLMREINDLFADETGAIRPAAFVMRTVPDEAADGYRSRALEIKAMPAGPERDAARQALLDELNALAQQPPGRLEQYGKNQRERDHRYLTDDTVRDVVPKALSAPREAINKVKALLKQTGSEMTDDVADAFLDEVLELNGLSRSERVAVIEDLVEEARQTAEVQRVLAGGAPVRVMTPEREATLLERQAVDIERLVFPEARQQFIRLHSVERLAMGRIQGIVRRTGVSLTEEQATKFVADANALQRASLKDQPAALDRLVNEVKDYPQVKAALEQQQSARDAEAAARREARQAANDLTRLTEPGAAGSGTAATPEDRAALNQIVGILRRTGTKLTPDQAETIRTAAGGLRDLPPAEARVARTALVDSVKGLDAVERATAQRAAETAAQQARKVAAERLAALMEAGSRARGTAPMASEEGRAFGQAIALLRKYGADLPTDMARQFEADITALGQLPVAEQADARRALIDRIKDFDPVKRGREAELQARGDAARLRQQGKDLVDLTQAKVYEAQTRVKNVEREAIRTAKARVRDAGVDMPESMARSFLDRAAMLQGMDAYDQLRAAQALMADVHSLIPPNKWDVFLDVIGLPRLLKATWDLSFIGRQGVTFAFGRPREWGSAFKSNIQAFASEEVAEAIDRAIMTGRLSKPRLEAGVERIDRFGALARREETFMSSWAGRIPGIKHSERAYTTTSNKLRADVWDNIVESWLPEELRGWSWESLDELVEASGIPQEQFMRLSSWVNAATGRGAAGTFLKTNSNWLNAVFFAPRFAVSRFEVPVRFMVEMARNPTSREGMLLRREIARDLVSFTVGTYAVLQMMDQVPGVSVEGDPRSSDFGKIRYGDTRYDFLGGYQPVIRFVTQMATGQSKSVGTGRISDVNRAELLGRFIASKLSPGIGMARDQLMNEDFIGRPVSQWGEAGAVGALVSQFGEMPENEWFRRLAHLAEAFVPFIADDTAEAWRAEGAGAGAVGFISGQFGGALTAFSTTRDEQNEVSRERFEGKGYLDLSPLERAEVNKSPKVQAAMLRAEMRHKTDAHQMVQVSLDNYRVRNEDIEAKLVKDLEANNWQQGQRVKQLIQDAKRSRYENAQTTFNETVEAAMVKGIDVPLKDLLRREYWSAQADEDPVSGDLDFKKRDAARADVLQRAQEAGIEGRYVTEQVSPWDDARVAALVEQLTAAQEAAKPYWDVRDEVERYFPGATEKAKAAMVTARRKVLRGAHYGDNPINKALVEWYGYERWKPSGPSLMPTPAPYGPAAGRSLVPTVAPVGRR